MEQKKVKNKKQTHIFWTGGCLFQLDNIAESSYRSPMSILLNRKNKIKSIYTIFDRLLHSAA